MIELIIGISTILCGVFIMCKLIRGIVRAAGKEEMTGLMERSLSIQAGNLSSRQKG